MQIAVFRLFFIFQIFMMMAVFPCFAAGKTDVYFRNKTDGSIKKNCFRIQGRYDAFPVLKCMDENGNAQEFDPGDIWEEVEIVPLCFEYIGNNPVIAKGTVKGRCVKIAGKENPEPVYRCFDEENNRTDFVPGADWREIPMNDERCKAFPWQDVLRGGSEETKKKYVEVQVFYGTDRKRTGSQKPGEFYGGDRGKLEYGTCRVSIPEDHRMGEMESPVWWKLEFKENPEKHVSLRNVNPVAKNLFFADLKKEIQNAKRKQAFVFVHGYNVTFADAARRTAQMAYDLKFAGAPVFYSWPSEADVKKYPVDEANVEWATPDLKEFLEDVAEKSGAEDVFLIAHSMGNRALTSAMGLFAEKPDSKAVSVFREIILAAPDIDADVFRKDIAPRMLKLNKRVTLYASSRDKALNLSQTFHKYPRAGDAEDGLVVMPGLDTIDVTNVDTSFMGHSYFGDNKSIITDIYYLIKEAKPAKERFPLKKEQKDNLIYWIFPK